MNEIQMFNNPEFGEIRSIQIDYEPWFVGRDIAAILGYSKPENAIAAHVDEEDKTTTLIQGIGSNYKSITTLINESGVYALIFGSKLDKAKAFKHWVTSEVLPQIRQTGGYAAPQQSDKMLDVQMLNARTANANIYVSLLQHIDTKSESYKSILMACAANTAAGQLVLPLPKCDFGMTYSVSQSRKSAELPTRTESNQISTENTTTISPQMAENATTSAITNLPSHGSLISSNKSHADKTDTIQTVQKWAVFFCPAYWTRFDSSLTDLDKPFLVLRVVRGLNNACARVHYTPWVGASGRVLIAPERFGAEKNPVPKLLFYHVTI